MKSENPEAWRNQDEVGVYVKIVRPFLVVFLTIVAIGLIFGSTYVNWDRVWKKVMEILLPTLTYVSIIGLAVSSGPWYQMNEEYLEKVKRRLLIVFAVICLAHLVYLGITSGNYVPLYR